MTGQLAALQWAGARAVLRPALPAAPAAPVRIGGVPSDLRRVVAVTARLAGVPADVLTGPRRDHPLVHWRQAGMAAAWGLGRWSTPRIARAFGCHHTTLLHALVRAGARPSNYRGCCSPDVRSYLAAIVAELEAAPDSEPHEIAVSEPDVVVAPPAEPVAAVAETQTPPAASALAVVPKPADRVPAKPAVRVLTPAEAATAQRLRRRGWSVAGIARRLAAEPASVAALLGVPWHGRLPDPRPDLSGDP